MAGVLSIGDFDFSQLLDISTKATIGSQLNWPMTEEKLFSFLKESCETPLDVAELPPVSVLVVKNELSVLLGREYASRKYPI